MAAAALVIAGLAVWGTTHSRGPFARGNLNDALIVLQTFVVLCTLTGLVLAADRRERLQLGRAGAVRRDLAVPWSVLLGSLAVAVLGWHLVASDVERGADERFLARAAELHDRLIDRMATNEEVLRGGVGLFVASHSVDRDEWAAYVAQLDLPRHHPGIQGLGFAVRLGPEERAAHEARVRAEGFPGYSVRPAGEWAAASAIVYIEPFDASNQRAFGFDMSSEPIRRAAMERACDTGIPALSGKVRLVQETAAIAQAGVLLYMPLYRRGLPLDSVAQRREALQGWVFSPIRMGNLASAAFGNVPEAEGLGARLYADASADESALLYAHDTGQVGRPRVKRDALRFGGQTWTLEVVAGPRFEARVDRQKAQIVLIAGVGFSLLLFVLVRSLTLTRERAELLASDMTTALRESEAKFRSLAESAGEAILTADADGRIVSCNRAAQRMFGQPAEALSGLSMEAVMPPRCRADHRAHLQRVHQGETLTVALAGLAADGREFPIEMSLASWEVAQGRYVSAIVRDITERERSAQALRDSEQAATRQLALRLRADAELQTQRAELERSNTELAQFAYAASHDLQEPLRTVSSFSQLLLRRHGEKLDGEAREFLGFIGEGARRSQALIADLLKLARLDSQAGALQPVSLQAVFDECRAALTTALQDSGATLTHDPLPTVMGEASQLRQLLQNLIGNALKFHGSAPPRVHVGAQREADHWRLSVTDHGIGIDPRFHARIFTLFQRLHRDEYPGTGIGLAICKKVVERHGGRIGVVSASGQGASFFFTMPVLTQPSDLAAQPEGEHT